MKRYLRKNDLAARYGVTPRNIDFMVKDGRIPAPFYLSRFPLWDEDVIDAESNRYATFAVGRDRCADAAGL